MKGKFRLILIILLTFIVCPVITGCFGPKKNSEPTDETVIIYFEQSTVTVEVGGTYQLEIKFQKPNVLNKTITWISNDETIATVDSNGLVTGIMNGCASITAISSSGYVEEILVYCIISPTSITLDKTSVEVYEGEDFNLVMTLQPSNTTEWYNVEWETSDSNIVDVNSLGNVYVKNAGTATITVRTNNGLVATCEVVVKPYIKVSYIVLNKSSNSVVIPHDQDVYEFNLTASVFPQNATYPEISWYSSNESVAIVDANGHVTVLTEGTAYIYAKTKDNVQKSCFISAKKEVLASSISITTNLSFIEGDNPKYISTTWYPSNTTYRTLTWSSSDESVAIVENGRVTPVSIGTAIITAKTKNGKIDTCTVTVNPKVYATSVTLNKTSVSVEETYTETLVATVLPENTTNKTIAWSSLDESIATVSALGVVTGIKAGTTTIIATTNNNITAECAVTVTELRVFVSAYVNGELYQTLETVESKNYQIVLPEKIEDITTNSSKTNYFYGWFSDEECLHPVTNETRYETNSAIYARDIQITTEGFTIDTTDTSFVKISKFTNPNNLDIVVIPKSINGYTISGIKSNAFNNVSNVTTLIFLNPLSFADRAISTTYSLKKIIFNKPATSISNLTIINCPYLEYNEYGGGYYLGSLDKPYLMAIKADDNATEIVLHNECVNIGNAFNNLEKLQSLVTEEENPYFSSIDGILYDKNKSVIKVVPKAISGNITIPNTITYISESSFLDRSKIISINLGGNVTRIKDYAFSGCYSLNQVTGCDKLTMVDDCAFYGCAALSSFAFNNLNSIGLNAFYGCSFLTVELPNSLNSIGAGSFGGNKYLTAITLPYIGSSTSTTLSSNTKYTLGYIFGTKSYTSSIKTTQSYYYQGKLTSTDYYLPYELKSITITGKEVYYGAFSNVSNNVDITLQEGITTIEENAFNGSAIGKLTIPTTITNIENNAFSVKSINDFYYDGELADWCSIDFASSTSNPASVSKNINFANFETGEFVIPTNITEIKDYVFLNFVNMTSVQFHNDITSIGKAAFSGTSIKGINFGEKLEKIDLRAFENCEKLENVNIPNNVISLGDYIFSGCVNLKTAILPKNLSTIPISAFKNCASLSSIEIPETITSIGSKAFYNCSSLKAFNILHDNVSMGTEILGNCASLESITLYNLGAKTPDYGLDDLLVYYFGDENFEGGYFVKQHYSNVELSAYLPNSLKSITILSGDLSNNLIENCSSLTDITIGRDVTRLGHKSFYNCTNLKNLNILATNLADMNTYNYAFVNAGINSTGLVVTFGKDVLNVPANFLASTSQGTTNVTEIIFEEDSKCEYIGSKAFAGLNLISTISIPTGVKNIGNLAFYKCKVISINVAENNEYYTSINGNLFTKDTTTLIQYAIAKTDTVFEITDNITSINSYAFAGAVNIQEIIYNTDGLNNLAANNHLFEEIGNEEGYKVTFGPSVTTISQNLFYPYSNVGANITEIAFAGDSACTTIGEYAFAYCVKLTKVNLPQQLTSVKSNAFYGCENINFVNYMGSTDTCAKINYDNEYANPMHYTTNFVVNNEKVTSIIVSSNVSKVGNFAFYNFVDVTSITLPNTFVSIGSNAFYNCANLTELYIPNASVKKGMLYGCSKLTTLQIPYIGDGSSTPNDNALFGYIFGSEQFANTTGILQYYDISSMTSCELYYIPNDIKTVKVSSGNIPAGAFYLCDNITAIEISDKATTINDYAFYGCNDLSSVNIEHITSIGKQAFSNCDSLTKIKLSDSLQILDNMAFAYCSSLKEADLGKSITVVADGLFKECANLKTIIFNDNITSIGANAFEDCMGLKNVELPKQLETIGTEAFYNCHGLYTITVWNKVKSIANLAFHGCYKLIEIYNLSSLEFKIGHGSNGGIAGNAKIVHTSASAESVLLNVDNYIFADINSKMYLITYEKDETDAILPTTDFNYTISSYAFLNLDNLQNVTLPSCVVGVETRAFTKCFNIDYLSLTSNIKTFPEDLLYDCDNLSVFNYIGTEEEWFKINFAGERYNPMNFANTFNLNSKCVTEFTIPSSATEVNPYTFYNFHELISLTIPKNVTKIGEGAFKNCISLQEITISNKVQTVGNQSFRNCSNLSKIELPSTVTSIGEYAFYDCMALEEFVIPTSLSELSLYSFANCSSLQSIVIPENIVKIQEGVFDGCVSIEEFYIPDSVTYIGHKVFANCSSIVTISLPKLSTEEEDTSGLFGLLFASNNPFSSDYVSVRQDDSLRKSYTFYLPKSLNNVTVRGGTIVYGAFQDCTSFNNLTLGDVSYVDFKAFTKTAPYVTLVDDIYYVSGWAIDTDYFIENANLQQGTVGIASKVFMDKNITEFNASSELRHIGNYAFKNCINLATVSVGNSLISVGNEVFYGCESIVELNLPNTLTHFGEQVLYGCASLTSINITEGCTNYVTESGVLYNGTKTRIIKYPSAKISSAYEMPETIKYIDDYAFMDTKMYSVNFCKSLVSIGKGAFYNSNLSRVTMYERVEFVGEYAFYNCTRLATVFIGENVQEIGAYAFAGCTELIASGSGGVNFPSSCAWDIYSEDGKSIEKTLSWSYELTTNNIMNVYSKNKWVRKY